MTGFQGIEELQDDLLNFAEQIQHSLNGHSTSDHDSSKAIVVVVSRESETDVWQALGRSFKTEGRTFEKSDEEWTVKLGLVSRPGTGGHS